MNDEKKNEHSPKGQEKEYEIIINGRPRTVHTQKISFKELIILAYGEFSENPNVCYTVTYKRGTSENSEGDLVFNECVSLKKGMVFNIGKTDKS